MKNKGTIAAIVVLVIVIIAGLYMLARQYKANTGISVADQLGKLMQPKPPALQQQPVYNTQPTGPFVPTGTGGNPFLNSTSAAQQQAQFAREMARSNENVAWITQGGTFLSGLTKGIFSLFDDNGSSGHYSYQGDMGDFMDRNNAYEYGTEEEIGFHGDYTYEDGYYDDYTYDDYYDYDDWEDSYDMGYDHDYGYA